MTKARDLGDFISDGTIAETVTADGLNLGDNEKIQLGASQDLQLYHDGSNSWIKDEGTGVLAITTNGNGIGFYDPTGTEPMLFATKDNAVDLYFNGSIKLSTTSTGATVTGTIAVSGDFNATSGTFTVQSNGTDILNVTSTLMSPQTDGAISIGSASNAFNDLHLDGSAYVGGLVGIGTSSPDNKLQISDSTVGTDSTADDNNFIKLTNKDVASVNEVWGLGFSSESGGTDYLGGFVQALGNYTSNFNTSLIFGTRGTSGNATERMRIDSSGVVRIGGQTGTLKLGNDATYYADIEWEYNNNELAFTANNTANFTFNSNGSERMRLDSSGNLLVGKTANNLTDDGIVLRGSGELFVTRASDVAAFNRRSTDGDIVTFRRDGTTVGSIGSNNGNIKISAFGEEYAALSGTTPTVDCQSGNNFALSTTGNTTFTFSNPPTSGTAFGFTLKVTAGGTHSLTWPASVDWAGGTAPDAPASGETNVLVFITYDGGTTWYGFQAGAALA